MKAGSVARLVLASAAMFILGCGGPGVGMQKVTGKVTVAGSPMQDITVTFLPTSGRPASGITDSSGNFTLATFSKGDGAVEGKHKVSFAYRPAKPSDSSGGKPANIPDSSMSAPAKGGAGGTTPGRPLRRSTPSTRTRKPRASKSRSAPANRLRSRGILKSNRNDRAARRIRVSARRRRTSSPASSARSGVAQSAQLIQRPNVALHRF